MTSVMAALGCAVFAVAALFDYADTQNKLAIEARDPHRAARWSVAMYLLGAVGVLSVIKVSLWFMVPECLGLYIGSVVGVSGAPKERAALTGVALDVRERC